MLRRTWCQTKALRKAKPFSIRCEQSSGGTAGLDVWLGRLAMVGFASAVTVEIATGKGLLEVGVFPFLKYYNWIGKKKVTKLDWIFGFRLLQNFGLTSPIPLAALVVAGLAGSLTALFIFQSASKD